MFNFWKLFQTKRQCFIICQDASMQSYHKIMLKMVFSVCAKCIDCALTMVNLCFFHWASHNSVFAIWCRYIYCACKLYIRLHGLYVLSSESRFPLQNEFDGTYDQEGLFTIVNYHWHEASNSMTEHGLTRVLQSRIHIYVCKPVHHDQAFAEK